METAAGIMDILRDSKKANSMGDIGRARVEKYYTKKQLIDRYVQLYESLGD